MKFLILAALVATCACANLSLADFIPNPPRFVSGKEYGYDYESQIMTGLPTFSRQYAGMKIQCRVKIAFTSDTSCTIQMVNIKVMTLNDEIKDHKMLPPTRQLPTELFRELPADETKLIVSKLRLPLKFGYRNGKVENIQVTTEETNWSIDAKRGVLSMLQVKLQATESRIIKKLPYNDLNKDGISTFDVLEAGPEGTCYSTHHVFDSPDGTANRYKVIKARDHSRCIKLNSIDKNVYPQRQVNCDCSSNMNNQNCNCLPVSSHWNISATTYNKLRTEYEIMSTDNKTFIICKAVQSVEYRVEAQQANNQYTTTISNQTLIMTNQSDQITIRTDRWSFKSISEPWKMQILPKDEEKLMMTVAQLTQNIRQLLNDMVEIATKPERFDDQPVVFSQIVDNIRLCQQHELQALFLETKKDYRQRNTFLDALRTANTTEADQLIITRVISGEITNSQAIPIFIVWAAEKVPTRTLLDNMKDHLLPSVQPNAAKKFVYYHSMLCYGSMVRRYIHSEEIWMSQCVLPADKNLHQKNIDNCRQYEKYVEGRLTAANTTEERIMVLKTIANLGSIKSLPMLQNQLSTEKPLTIRVHAVWAFNNLGFQNKLKTTETLLPIMLHHREDTELRCAAFIMVMKCNPTTSLWAVERHLNNERDVEFKTFVVKYLHNILEKREPRCEQRRMQIRQILKSIRAFRMSEETIDFQLKYGLKNTERDGDMLRFTVIANATAPTPRSFTFQQLTGQNNEMNNLVELGYRAEGLESLMSMLPNDAPITDLQKIGKHAMKLVAGQKPSVTFYVRMLGQQITFAHFDEQTVMSHSHLMKISSEGMTVEIPIALFHTIALTPRQLSSFQPTGTWLQTELNHYAVVNVEGTLRVTMTLQQPMPVVTFTTSKPIRFEILTSCNQYVDWGFAKTGLTGLTGYHTFAKAQKIDVRFDMERNFITKSFTRPSTNEFGRLQFKAMSLTFVLPKRLPKVVLNRQQCSIELKVDESERKTFSSDVDFLKNIDIEARIEGVVNVPEWFNFARDRMLLIPTKIYTYKQNVSLIIRPVRPDQTIVVTGSSQFVTPTNEEFENPREKRSFFSGLYSKLGLSSDSEEYEQIDHAKNLFQRQGPGSLCRRCGFSLASVSQGKTLNASSNWTTCYEHDAPTTHAVLKMVLPANGQRVAQQFVDQISTTVDPSTSRVEQDHKIQWGPKSAPTSHTITVTNKFRPSFKDNVCHEQTAYGCKDDYGVIYPIYYNNTMRVRWENNKVPEQIRDWVEPLLFNMAESVYMYPNRKQSNSENSLDMDFIARPLESKIDYIFRDTRVVKNMSRVYDPVGIKIHNYIAVRQRPLVRSDAVSYFGDIYQHPSYPYDVKRDTCVCKSSKVHTFDKKTLQLTDCEVVLIKKCDRSSDPLRVSVIPSAEHSAPKQLNILLGSKKIQMKFDDSQVIKVYVDEQLSEIPEGRLMVKEGDNTIASIECSKERCDLVSRPHGLYIVMDRSRASVEVDSDRTSHMCGMCAARPELPKDVPMSKSLAIIRENLVSGQGSCNMNETCSKLKEYRVAFDRNQQQERLTCVTLEQVMLCSDACTTKPKRRQNDIRATCVTDTQARTIGLDKAQKTVGGEKVVDDPTVLRKLRAKGVTKKVAIDMYIDCQP